MDFIQNLTSRTNDGGKGVEISTRLERSECLGETAQIVGITSLQKRIPTMSES